MNIDKHKEYNIAEGYYVKCRKHKDVIVISIYNVNSETPVLMLKISNKDIRNIYIPNIDNLLEFIYNILILINKYAKYEEECYD